MIHYKTLDELKADLNEYGDLIVNDDVTVDFDIPAGVMRDFLGRDFLGGDFSGRNFLGRNLLGRNFTGWDFTGGNFTGLNFVGNDINYYATFICYESCTCRSHKSRRENALPIQCLDGELTVESEG